MKNHTASGILLVASGLVIVFVMLHHPTGHALMSSGSFERMARLNMNVHGAAIAVTLATFLGLMGVARRLGWSDLSIAAMVAFGFASVAVMMAALASGFIFTEVAAGMSGAEGSGDPHALMDYTHLWNQGFAKLHLVTFSAGMLLLAGALLRTGRGRIPGAVAAGAAGILAGLLVLAAFFSGRVGLDVRGALVLYTTQSAWTAWLGVTMLLKAKPAAD